jgi:hypothetical protein
LVLDKREVSDARWVTLEEIDRFKIFDGDREFYQKVLPLLLKRTALQ